MVISDSSMSEEAPLLMRRAILSCMARAFASRDLPSDERAFSDVAERGGSSSSFVW